MENRRRVLRVASYDVKSCETPISNEVVIDGKKQGYKGAGGVYVEDLPDSYDTIPEECLENEKGEDGEFDRSSGIVLTIVRNISWTTTATD